jgi:hypothetical protein
MFALSLKEAFAVEQGKVEQVEICRDAEAKFLAGHLGQWTGLLAESMKHSYQEGIFLNLACFTAAFIQAHAHHLGTELTPRRLAGLEPTPLGPELSCNDCPAFEALG